MMKRFYTTLIALLGILIVFPQCSGDDSPKIAFLLEKSDAKVIANKGYWKAPGAKGTRNSRASLREAIQLGVWGSDIDVYVTADEVGRVVLYSNESVGGQRIDESTYEELKDAITLSNGETIPTLDEILDIALNQTDYKTTLVIQIKKHLDAEKEEKAVAAVLELVKNKNAKGNLGVEFTSESQYVCELLLARNPNAKVYYLGGDLTPNELAAAKKGYTGVGYDYAKLLENEEWIEEALLNNLKIKVWTLNDQITMKRMVDLKVAHIITDEPIVLQEVIDDTEERTVIEL